MQRDYISSSSIVSVGYDPATETLEIEFNSGAVYQYYNVSQSIYEELMEASSKGKFFAYQVKNFFPYSRV